MVSLLRRKRVEGLRGKRGIVLQDGLFVPLEAFEVFASAFENLQFVPSRGPRLVKGGELGPQLVKGDESFGGHVLKATPLAVGYGQLLKPGLCLTVRVAAQPLTF